MASLMHLSKRRWVYRRPVPLQAQQWAHFSALASGIFESANSTDELYAAERHCGGVCVAAENSGPWKVDMNL